MDNPEADQDRGALARVENADISLERDLFVRTLLRELAGTLEEVIGLEEASGFISVVGDRVGQMIDESYREALDTDQLSVEEVGHVLVDLKRRIEGDFFLIEVTDEAIVLGNRACPFGDKVLDRPSLCMMTSNVFGSITAANVGYAKVELQETIAQGAGGCRVVVHLRPEGTAITAEGREYFGTNVDPS